MGRLETFAPERLYTGPRPMKRVDTLKGRMMFVYGTPEGRGSFRILISELGMSESSVGGCTHQIHISSLPLHYLRVSIVDRGRLGYGKIEEHVKNK